MTSERGVCIIAEAGVNHNGSLDRALQMVDLAADAGADYVKFQSFNAKRLVTKNASKADYQKKQTDVSESQLQMLEALELSHDMHEVLISRCESKSIGFMSAPFDEGGVKYLATTLNLPVIKISSGDLTNPLVLVEASATGKNLVLSTGMGDMAELELALGCLAFSASGETRVPSEKEALDAWQMPDLRAMIAERVTVLHCTTEYPTPYEDVNLRAMNAISTRFGVKVGYSDHTPGIWVPIAAVAMGATAIEKHFTLDRTLPGPDHVASLEPDELKQMVADIRGVEVAFGSGMKSPVPSELKNIPIARKSIVATTEIMAGDMFTLENLTVKRPGTGISPMKLAELLGTISDRRYGPDDVIERNVS